MALVGTWSWAQSTGGSLRRRDRAELLRQGVLARLAVWAPGRAHALGRIELPTPPDSALARSAEERVRELSDDWLYAHCLRTWAYSALLAAGEAVPHDRELLYLACVLHDLGLTAAHDRVDDTACCFAVEGARAAQALVRSGGASAERARVVAEAISLHLNIAVPRRLGAEAYLLSRGVSLDTVGRRSERLSHADVDDVERRWPRTDLAERLIDANAAHARARPASRSAFLRRVGFDSLLRANPLAVSA
jgi:hypothetical protein